MRRLAFLLSLSLLSACNRGGGSDQGKNHRVRAGDSLFAIAERAYGNGLEWPRIWEANPWLDPDHLRSGEVIYVPPSDDTWGDPPPYKARAVTGIDETDDFAPVPGGPGTLRSSDPGGGGGGAGGIPGVQVFRNLASQVKNKTIFGLPLQQTVLVVFIFFLAHAAVQTLIVWLAANLTFVKDASMKKAIKAVFQTDMLTFCTLMVLAALGTVLIYAGSSGGEGGTSQLFPFLEDQLRSPVGMAVGAFALLIIYIVLSLRFLPQAFGLKSGRAIPLMFVAVLIPHLGALYLVGQRMGWIF